MKRWPLFAAIAYVVLLFIGLFVLPKTPGVTASGTELVRYMRDHGDTVRFVAWLGTLATIPIVLLFAHLRSRLTGTGRDVMLLGAASVVVTTIVWQWFNAGLALHADTLDPHIARTVADVSVFFGPMLTVSIVLTIVPLGLAAWRGAGGMPRWFAVFTAVFATEQMIETITVMGKRGFLEPGGAMNFTLGAGLYAVWVVAAGVASSPA
jgi:hypothetical protein